MRLGGLMEHRWGQRIVVDMPIQLIAADKSLTRSAQLANLSITGGFVKADFRPRLLSRVQVVFASALSPPAGALSIDAYIARNSRHGIGVEWCELASPTVTDLLRAAGAQMFR
jgi:hypothetical protein